MTITSLSQLVLPFLLLIRLDQLNLLVTAFIIDTLIYAFIYFFDRCVQGYWLYTPARIYRHQLRNLVLRVDLTITIADNIFVDI